MSDYAVVERKNPLAVYYITWSIKRGQEWIERYGDRKLFSDKTLTKESFTVIPYGLIKDKR